MTSNPLDDLRQINRQQREAQEPTNDTGGREDGSTASRTAVRTAVREEGATDARKSVSTALSTSSRPSVRKEERKGGREEGSTDTRTHDGPAASPPEKQAIHPDLRTQVRDTVSERRVYQGGVKATLDLAPGLSTRFKRYSIDHHNVTLRQLMTELLDSYLSGEGY